MCLARPPLAMRPVGPRFAPKYAVTVQCSLKAFPASIRGPPSLSDASPLRLCSATDRAYGRVGELPHRPLWLVRSCLSREAGDTQAR
jgi:hypothetical protein